MDLVIDWSIERYLTTTACLNSVCDLKVENSK